MAGARILDERIDGLSHAFRISVDAERINTAVQARLQDIGRTALLPGFRRGRAPLSVLRSRFGDRVGAAAVDHLAIGVARRLIAERKLQPTSRPVIHLDADAPASSGPVTFMLLLEVMPQVVLGAIEGLRLRRLDVADGDQDLRERVDRDLRRQLFDALLADHQFPVPRDMTENEYQRVRRGFEIEVGEAVDQDLDQELREVAERRIRLAILLTEIGRKYDIRVERAEVEALIEREVERHPEHEAGIIDFYLDHSTALAELQMPLFESRVVDFLLDRADVELVQPGKEELQRVLDQS